MIQRYHPWAIIHASANAEEDGNSKDCCKINCFKTNALATVCGQHHIKLMSFSSHVVFDGKKDLPYVETDPTNPVNTFGQRKHLEETSILNLCTDAVIVRTSVLFGLQDKNDFIHRLLNNQNRDTFFCSLEEKISPTYAPHLVDACLDLLIDNASGIWHLTNKGCLTWYEFAKNIIEKANLDIELIKPVHDNEIVGLPPFLSALASVKYNRMPSLDEALNRYFLSDCDHSFTLQNSSNERI